MDEQEEEVIKKPKKAKKLTPARKKRQARKTAKKVARRMTYVPPNGGNSHQRRKQARIMAGVFANTLLTTDDKALIRRAPDGIYAYWLHPDSSWIPIQIAFCKSDTRIVAVREQALREVAKAIRRVHSRDIPIEEIFSLPSIPQVKKPKLPLAA